MKPVLGCIADDFTGATDLAGLLSRSGVAVRLRLGVPSTPPTDTSAFEVIALKCRTSPVDEAVAECRAALAWLKAAGAERFFWKYCSTFDCTSEGNIGPVAEALMADIGAEQTIYCPAFPENGRSIYMGNLFVGQQPLAESPMKDHPLTPMTDSNLMRLLTPQVTKPVGLAAQRVVAQGAKMLRSELAALQDENVAHVVVDAVADENLQTIAEACWDMKLMTGGSAVAMPLPSIYVKHGLLPSNAPSAVKPNLPDEAVILSGSCSKMTRAQVAAYSLLAPSFRLDPIELAEHGAGAALRWLAEQDLTMAPLIYASAEPDQVRAAQDALGVARAGAIVEEALAELVIAARNQGARRIIAAGGETSGAIALALGISDLAIGAEIAPGVPWCYAVSGGHDIAIALKSGNFGTETFFTDALNALEQS
ncbi:MULTISPECIES: 3-oxo-tetronate kinase [Pacificibacter]|uniref:3-oxo-tetronate kinase n=1 Tax=Pacificibacter TaxID=1042323 RepID=UPI001C09D8A3|nr:MULTISPECIES: 3-oxo-tetronate kinase [Pacificibacter]MBU2936722.1 four-carbon acid sugar kinase family protein [Pacificibacter marinus]MDO6614476.1 four-carbon acid sugar kinase family protein [Pacificibacter sp. 1_MG-2023]